MNIDWKYSIAEIRQGLVSAIFFILFLSSMTGIVNAETNLEFFFGGTSKYKDIIVEEVISTDTIVLKGGERVGLIGLRSAKIKISSNKTEKKRRDEYGFVMRQTSDLITPIEETALDFVKELLEGKHVRLEFDAQKEDDEYRTMAYVFLVEQDTSVNVEILAQGFARLQIRPPNLKYTNQLRAAYKKARSEQRGMLGAGL